jgi:excisionase family DNA binding protein
MNADTLTLAEVAELADVSHDTVRRWCARGLLPSPLPEQGLRRREYRFDRDAVEAALLRVRAAKAVLSGQPQSQPA